jgi:hypothetical protein
MVLDVNDAARGDGEYFKKICKQMENGGCEALHYFLQNYDISKVNLRKIPRTKALMDQITHSMTSIMKFWYDGLQEEGFYKEYEDNTSILWPWESPIGTKELYDAYLLATKNINGKNHLSQAQFGCELKKICSKIVKKRMSFNQDRAMYYSLPPLEECRKDFEIMFRMENIFDRTTENDLDENNTEEAQSAYIPFDNSPLQDDIMGGITI